MASLFGLLWRSYSLWDLKLTIAPFRWVSTIIHYIKLILCFSIGVSDLINIFHCWWPLHIFMFMVPRFYVQYWPFRDTFRLNASIHSSCFSYNSLHLQLTVCLAVHTPRNGNHHIILLIANHLILRYFDSSGKIFWSHISEKIDSKFNILLPMISTENCFLIEHIKSIFTFSNLVREYDSFVLNLHFTGKSYFHPDV